MDCPFCDPEIVIFDNDHAVAVPDRSPVSRGHTLIIPKRHVETLFDATDEEVLACWQLVQQVRDRLEGEYSPDGYNIAVNSGRAAGQSVMHAHIHVIPRYGGKGISRRETGG
ncbi:MAG TPA: HIT family protein [Candidatus Krumholzibacterium sp.]|nr:HIT family protein [Candidatus Krumholzibacterium sp.]